VTGQFQYGFGENGAAASGTKANNYFGFRIGYAAGPVSVHVANGKTSGATAAADTKYTNIGASFDAGVVKPMVFWGTEKNGAGAKVTGLELGLVAPVGAGEIRAAWSKYDVAASSNDATKLALGYVHNVSKRTALYGTYAKVSNKGAQTLSVANNGLSAGAAAAGGGSTGYEFGLRHSF
jgi:predicted porin